MSDCGFTLIEWDGTYVLFSCMYLRQTDSFYLLRTNFALVDSLGHIVARCLGFPADSRWESICKGACAAMDRALVAMGAPQRDPNGRRGWFTTLFTGFSMGGGQQVCFYYHFVHFKAYWLSTCLVPYAHGHEVAEEC